MNPQNGAEATVAFSAEGHTVTKTRSPKGYRNAVLDEELRRRRNAREAKILLKAPVRVPKIIRVDDYAIVMEQIAGKRLRDALQQDATSAERYAHALGTTLSTLHNADIIHGDLTTSNVLVEDHTDQLVLIDFGLSSISKRLEDRAVDLHVLRETLAGSHPRIFDTFWDAFAQSYGNQHVLERLIAVEKRGRYKGNY